MGWEAASVAVVVIVYLVRNRGHVRLWLFGAGLELSDERAGRTRSRVRGKRSNGGGGPTDPPGLTGV